LRPPHIPKERNPVICLPCAEKHPHFKKLNHPAPLQKMPCQLCRSVEWCVANHTVGLPDKFLTVEEAFRLIAENIIKPPKG
jgi:hypothetical protein